MPQPKSSRSSSGDIWRRHASEIWKLYRDRTVEEVKLFMEKEKGFPVMKISTWNEKLGQHKMRKNVTRDEWRQIYLHCLPRLEDPTRTKGDLKLKRTKMETEIIVRGRKYSWEQAWKNMKSAGVIGQLLPPGGKPIEYTTAPLFLDLTSRINIEPLSPLPPDVVIRTPVAIPSSSISLARIDPFSLENSWERASGTIYAQETGFISRDHLSINRESNDRSSGEIARYLPFDRPETRTIVPTAMRAEIVWDLSIASLPIAHVVSYTIEIANLAAPSATTLQDLTPITRAIFASTKLPLESPQRWNLAHHFLSEVFARPSNGLSTVKCQESYIRLFMVIYVVSNNLVDHGPYDEVFDILDSIFAAVPVKYLNALLYKRLDSIRAAFEALLRLAGDRNQQKAFRFLVEAGAEYDWLDISGQGHLLLYYAASMNAVPALRTLLDKGCRPDLSMPDWCIEARFQSAIVQALSCGNLQCAQLLLERCDVNKSDWCGGYETNFENFLNQLDEIGELSEIGLKLFIKAGADVDKPIQDPLMISVRRHWNWNWNHSATDYLFYFHRPLFNTLPPESARGVQSSHLSRAGILQSLQGGIQSLESYVDRLAPQLNQEVLDCFFQRLIIEQFFMIDMHYRIRDTDLEIIRTLSSFGARFGASINAVLGNFPGILHSIVEYVDVMCGGIQYGRGQIEAVMFLVENGATVTGRVLSWMSWLPDIRPLALALGSIKIPKGLEIAVAHAAQGNNFAAVEMLLQAGAKLNTDFRHNNRRSEVIQDRISIIARVISNPNQRNFSQMLKFLLMKGARLRLSKRKPHLHQLLQFTLDHWGWEEQSQLLERVQYIVGSGFDLRHSPFPTAPLLEACGSTQVFEYLYRNGAQLRPGSPLAVWIAEGGGIELCREMLNAGAEPHAYIRHNRSLRSRNPLQVAARKFSVDIVDLLLRAGSDVHAPTTGYQKVTALQASCGYTPLAYSFEDHQRKLRTIRLLLAHDTDVNATSAYMQGMTALHLAAASGDMAVAKLLLFHAADVNAPSFRTDHLYEERNVDTALDLAAQRGRIDMVKLLLNYNAISHDRGKTGYDGAIRGAREKGHLAVADLICQHAEDVERLEITIPELSQPRRDHHDYYYAHKRAADWGSGYSEDEEESTPCSDKDELGVSENAWQEDVVGCVFSDIHQGDTPVAAQDNLDHSLARSLSHDEFPAATANETNGSSDQKVFSLAPDEDLMGLWHSQPSLDGVGCDTSMDFNMSFGDGESRDAVGKYTALWVPEHGAIFDAASFVLAQERLMTSVKVTTDHGYPTD